MTGARRRAVAIDGPAAAGKTTVARALAACLGVAFFDTGVLYRAVTVAALRAGLAPTDGAAVADLAKRLRIEVVPAAGGGSERVLVNGEDVTLHLRSPEVDEHVSAIAAHPEVRAALLPVQRSIADQGPVVMVGRDITTVVLPDASVRVYLDATPQERARRRCAELRARGEIVEFADVLREIERRDRIDASRAVAPLRAAEGVTVVDTDGRTVEEVVGEIAALVERVWREESADRERKALS